MTAMTEPNDLKGEMAEVLALIDESESDDVIPAYRSRNLLRTHGARLKRALEIAETHDAVCDSNYAAGMVVGWNCCNAGDDVRFNKIIEERRAGAASAIKAARASEQTP